MALAWYNRELTKVSSHVREVGSKHRPPLRPRIERILDQNMIEGERCEGLLPKDHRGTRLLRRFREDESEIARANKKKRRILRIASGRGLEKEEMDTSRIKVLPSFFVVRLFKSYVIAKT